MKKVASILTVAALAVSITTSANAQASGDVSVWGMGVITSHGKDESDRCDPNGEFCANVLGWGASASVHTKFSDSYSVSADLFYEFHGDTNADSGDRNDHASYGHLGVHLINESNPNMPWGGFMFLASGANLADDDSAGPVLGFGAEIMVSDFVIQGGGMWLLDRSNAEDTLENMAFIGVSHDWQMGNGVLKTGVMLGTGDFEEDTPQYDKGNWGQLSVFYEAPLGNGNMNWFAGYQLDYVDGFGGGNLDKALFHAVKIGITIPLGNGGGSKFKTPNFRAPLTAAGEMNS